MAPSEQTTTTSRSHFTIEAMGDLSRTCYCGEITEKHINQRVTVMGWVDRSRDLGNLVFLDLRDREGMVQIVADPVCSKAHKKSKEIRSEDVIAVVGRVVERSEETVNPQMPTGRLEVQAEEIRLLNPSLTPPFPITDGEGTAEERRLKYRYLDLRRPRLQGNLRLRHQISLEVRNFLDSQGFTEIETPFLTKSTPEGARDYLVPSRIHPGQFYALPQSPQLFKQLLMVAGFDRYFQIVRCFRDEDLRADRQPEFTQVDIEMSFVRSEDVFTLVESLLARVFQVAGLDLAPPFPRLTHEEAVARYGTDRPDTRFGLEIVDVGTAFADSAFEVFRQILDRGGQIRGIPVSGGGNYSRRELDDLTAKMIEVGASGLAWIKSTADGMRSSLPKIVEVATLEQAANQADLGEGDILLMVAGPATTVNDALSQLRLHLAKTGNLVPEGAHQCVWVYDFPLLEWNEEEGRFLACHHPFTSPRDENIELLKTDPGAVLAKAYDVVLDGTEIGGGSIRIHRQELQEQVFKALGILSEEAQQKFGFFLEALRFGAPPHGGIALGLDRIVMLLAGGRSLRDVISFPKTARAVDLMSGSPSPVSPHQHRELHIQVKD